MPEVYFDLSNLRSLNFYLLFWEYRLWTLVKVDLFGVLDAKVT